MLWKLCSALSGDDRAVRGNKFSLYIRIINRAKCLTMHRIVLDCIAILVKRLDRRSGNLVFIALSEVEYPINVEQYDDSNSAKYENRSGFFKIQRKI